MKRLLAVPPVVAVALALASAAFAHAEISPPVAITNQSQLFTLVVPTEKENAKTVLVELTLPSGFNIDSFVAAPGWKRTLLHGEGGTVTKVGWSGGGTPTDEDSVFQFLASTSSSKTYTFGVRQGYSDGSVVDWSGPEGSDTPAPTIESKSSLGGGGGSSTLEIGALILGAVALVVAVVALLAGRGGRSLA